MKPVYQTVFSSTEGDCFRACVASILEFPIEEMPNFWEQTQEAHEFWVLVDEWAMKRGFKCFSLSVLEGHEFVVENLLCVALVSYETGDGRQDHAIVWLNGPIHDPNPEGAGRVYDGPDCFTVFVPLNPMACRGGGRT